MDVIVPIKSFEHAKSRLGPILDGVLRRQLADTMARSVLGELKQVKALARILVVTSEPTMIRSAKSLGIEVLWEESGSGLNGALAQAEDLLGGAGHGIAVVCSDLPFFRAAEFERMLALHNELGTEAVTIARDRTGTGTNVRMVTAGCRFPYLYGENSAQAHALEAYASGLTHRLFESEALALDLDTPADAFEVFHAQGSRAEQASAVRTILSSPLKEITGDLPQWNGTH